MEIMISVLTLTYKRAHLLEEAIESFLKQSPEIESEMVVVNDDPDINYIYNHPKIKIINHKTRFATISAKIEWGYKQCKYDYIYRLDDDDLLTPWALENAKIDIQNNPGYDIYRSKGMYYFLDNKFQEESSNVNNGNIFAKKYLDKIKFPERITAEDAVIVFDYGAKIYISNLKKHTMIFRWGMNTVHISGLGDQTNEFILNFVDKNSDNTKGEIKLFPKFLNDYYSMIA
jgi:glycosyltransferase involved in cell wall biosynthesis